jgi:two-component system phosphate regulon sensor histidine kinase PhoR
VFRSRLFRRHVLAIGVAAAVGLIAGMAASSGVGRVVAVAVALLAAGVIAWWMSRTSVDSLAVLRGFVGGWRDSLETSAPALDADDDISDLRDELEAARVQLLEQQVKLQSQGVSLRRDTDLLQMVLGTMVEGVVVVDAESQLLYANPAARRLLQFGLRDVEGRLLHELTRSARLHEIVRRVLDSRTEQHVEFDLPRENRTLSVSAGPLPLDPAPGTVVVLYDVTELRSLERMRRDFVSNVSHELKTPLTSIQAYADSLLNGAIDDGEMGRKFVERIVEQSERLRTLILNLIGLARVESQQETLDIRPVVVQEVVAESLETHLAIAQAKRLSLTDESAPEPLTILADREALRTILDNLIRNALNYTPEEGRVTVRAIPGANEVIVEVQDTGIGIARDMQARVFERFFRVDKARSRDAGGTGLGLSIVKHLTQQLGGRIELESEVGRGSLFRVAFPRDTVPTMPENGGVSRRNTAFAAS